MPPPGIPLCLDPTEILSVGRDRRQCIPTVPLRDRPIQSRPDIESALGKLLSLNHCSPQAGLTIALPEAVVDTATAYLVPLSVRQMAGCIQPLSRLASCLTFCILSKAWDSTGRVFPFRFFFCYFLDHCFRTHLSLSHSLHGASG